MSRTFALQLLRSATPKTWRSRLVWAAALTLLLIAVTAGILDLLLSGGADSHEGGLVPGPQSASELPLWSPSGFLSELATPARLGSLNSDVAARVQKLNSDEAREVERFAAAGWQLIDDAPPPDARLLVFDPSLLTDNPPNSVVLLRRQLATTALERDHLENVAAIVRQTTDAELRRTAIAALGRSRSDEAGLQLLSLLQDPALSGGVSDAEARTAIAAAVRPADLDAPVAAAMVRLLDARSLSETEREVLAATLALLALRDGTSLPESVLEELSDDSRTLLEQMYARVARAP